MTTDKAIVILSHCKFLTSRVVGETLALKMAIDALLEKDDASDTVKEFHQMAKKNYKEALAWYRKQKQEDGDA